MYPSFAAFDVILLLCVCVCCAADEDPALVLGSRCFFNVVIVTLHPYAESLAVEA